MSAKIILQSITTVLLAIIACSLLLLLGEKMGFVHFGKKHAVAAHIREKSAHLHKAGCDEKVDLPAGYFVEFGGQFENQERAMKKLCIIVPIVIGIILLLLWMTFNSFRSSLIVMINVPLALIGGVIGLWITNQLLSVPAAVGFIALFGIAMQDAVVMVTDFRELRAAGVPLCEAIIQGSKVRFKSVILTTLTTLLGLIPLLLSHGIGAEVQKPLAAIVVFGLATSTLLTLFFLLTLYYVIERRFEK